MKKVFKFGCLGTFFISGLLFIIGLIGMVLESDESEQNHKSSVNYKIQKDKEEATNDENIFNSNELNGGNWKYHSYTDEMTGEVFDIAMLKSENTHSFKFPYDGGSSVYLFLRKKGAGNNIQEVYLKIDNGQILYTIAGSIDDEKIRIKYDDDNPISYYFSQASDYSSNYAFFKNPSQIFNRIKASKQIKIDLPIYEEGRPVFTFKTEGLTW